MGTKLKYTPLDYNLKQIRLLHICIGNLDPVECTLHVCDLAKNPRYETISYVWGDPEDRDVIRVNGSDISVPASSARAIRRVRRQDQEPRVIWIDAICIDQSNTDERSHQVAIMGQIFANGFRNLICLGEGSFDAAVRSARAIVQDAVEQDENYLLSTFRWTPTSIIWEASRSNRIRVPYDRQALVDLYTNSWFSRVWTYQEAALAQENLCLCDDLEFPLLDVTKAASWLLYNRYFVERSGPEDDGIITARRLDLAVNTAHGEERLNATPSSIRERLCSIPVDKIYGSLGILNPHGIIPDYRKTTRDVFENLAIKIIQSVDNLDLLRTDVYTQSTDDQAAELASWTPNWIEVWDGRKHPYALGSFFNASGEKELVCDGLFEKNPFGETIMKTRGVELGTIRNILDVFHDDGEAAGLYCLKHGQAQDLVTELIGSQESSSAQDLNQITARILTADEETGHRASFEPLAKDFRAYIDNEETKEETLPLKIEFAEDTPENIRRARTFWDDMDHACRHRVLFSTNKHVGLSPKITEAGDIAVILFGSNCPMILRHAGDHYMFVGVAYIYGVMDGEAVQGDALDEKIFPIR